MAGFFKITLLFTKGMVICKDREERSFRMWFGAEIEVHIKRRSLHTRAGTIPRIPLKQSWRWGTGISGQSLMNFAYLEESAHGNSTI